MSSRVPLRNVLATATAQSHQADSDAPPPSSKVGSGIRRAVTLPPPSSSQPTDPLASALAFLEGIASRRLCRDDLRSWLDRHLVQPGILMVRPIRLQEPLFGALPSDVNCSAYLPDAPPVDETTAMLVRARARVVGKLRGLLQTPADDRFLSAAIFAGRVRRILVDNSMAWVPRPRPHDILSDIITSLFVADILGRREFYAQNLCICDTCGRVRFNPDPMLRHSCLLC
jgi:hypothetical protein